MNHKQPVLIGARLARVSKSCEQGVSLEEPREEGIEGLAPVEEIEGGPRGVGNPEASGA